MTQNFVDRIAENFFDYNRNTVHGKYVYSVKGVCPDNLGPWEYWIVRCPRGGENDDFLTHDGRIVTRWEKIIKL